MKDDSENIDWRTGQIKFFDNNRGFGFVECWDDGQDYFVHISNVDAGPIIDADYVVFKLGYSSKKPGTQETKNLTLINKFSKDPNYLKEIFLTYQNEYFRKEIIQRLSSTDIINLLEQELSYFQIIETEDDFSDFNKIIKFYLSINTSDSLSELIGSFISSRVEQIATPNFKIRSWLDGILFNPPDNELLQYYFISSIMKDRLLILSRIDGPKKKELIQGLITHINTHDILDLILEHLKQINDLGVHADVKSKLYEKEFWTNKIDYDLFETAIKIIQESHTDKVKLSLYLSGYLNNVSSSIILDACLELSRDEIEKIFADKILSKTDVFNTICRLLMKEIEPYWSSNNIPNEEFAFNSKQKDWERYFEAQIEPFKWILQISNQLSESKKAIIINTLVEKLPECVQVELWVCRNLKDIPPQSISKYLQISDNLISDIDKWLNLNIITKEEIAYALKSNIQTQKEIENRKEFYILFNHVQACLKLVIDLSEIEYIIPPINLWFYKLTLWLEGISTEFNFDEYKTKLVFLFPYHQILFLKKLFRLAHIKEFNLTVEKLSQLTRIDFDIYSLNQDYNPDLPLDISVDIVIEAIKSFSENGKFLFENELLLIVLKDLAINKKHRFKISELFEMCPGRCEAIFDWNTDGELHKVNFGHDKYYFAFILNPGENVDVYTRRGGYTKFVPNNSFERLKEAIKRLPGSKWNPKEGHWGVPSTYEEQVLQFARKNRIFIKIDKNIYANNTHLANIKRTTVPDGIIYCEGRLATNIHHNYKRAFWWCCNKECLSNCETIHEAEKWNEYTLLDFFKILGFDLNDGNRVGDNIEKGKYYQFISSINRFNRLLDKMYCEKCGHILFPVEDSHFAHYRVARFHCENVECSLFHYEIYLHHCLNGRCNEVIDSRKSKKCNNGLYICSNENCGCCCSHSMFQRRLSNLIKVDIPNTTSKQRILSDLQFKIDNKLGHLERAEHFCYQCGELMDELKDDKFQCRKCNIQYDVSSNRFKRPHRDLKRIQENLSTNHPSNNLDINDYVL